MPSGVTDAIMGGFFDDLVFLLTNAGVGTGVGASVGVGAGVGTGVDAGVGAGVDAGVDVGAGVGAGVDVDAGVGAGVDVDAGVGAGVETTTSSTSNCTWSDTPRVWGSSFVFFERGARTRTGFIYGSFDLDV